MKRLIHPEVSGRGRALAAGALTAEDFERFDAELLRCLQ
jgi:hypothetical protein